MKIIGDYGTFYEQLYINSFLDAAQGECESGIFDNYEQFLKSM